MIIHQIDNIEFKLKHHCDLAWIKRYGTVFTAIDGTGSGCICFGISNGSRKYFLKIAGVDTLDAEVSPEESIETLKNAVRLYEILSHPNLIQLIDHYFHKDYYVAVFEWAKGDCLFDYWNFQKYSENTRLIRPSRHFHELTVDKVIASIEIIFSFLETVAAKGYVAVDFYDGSLIYDFNTDKLTICDIDLFRKQPAINDMGDNFWGTKRLKSPEEYIFGASIDECTNVFTVGALIFNFLGEFTPEQMKDCYCFNKFIPCPPDKWRLSETSYQAVLKAVNPDRSQRYQTMAEFHEVFRKTV